VEGCITTTSYRPIHCVGCRRLVLTDARHSFVAWISISGSLPAPNNIVVVEVNTFESVASGVHKFGAFKDRFPETTRLARAVLGAVISATVFDR